MSQVVQEAYPSYVGQAAEDQKLVEKTSLSYLWSQKKVQYWLIETHGRFFQYTMSILLLKNCP